MNEVKLVCIQVGWMTPLALDRGWDPDYPLYLFTPPL